MTTRGWVQTSAGLRPCDDRLKQIVFEIEAGRPFADIADQFRVTVQYISYIRAKAGIPRRVQPKS